MLSLREFSNIILKNNSLLSLLFFNYLINSLNTRISQNLLWCSLKYNLIYRSRFKTMKYNVFLTPKTYYSLLLKYDSLYFKRIFVIFFSNIVWANALLNYKFKKVSCNSLILKKKIYIRILAYWKFLKKQFQKILYLNFKGWTSHLIFQINNLIWNSYQFFRNNTFLIPFKKWDSYLYHFYLRWINKKYFRIKNVFNISMNFRLRNLKCLDKHFYFMNFKYFEW